MRSLLLLFGLIVFPNILRAESKPFVAYMAKCFNELTPNKSEDELVRIWQKKMGGKCSFSEDKTSCEIAKPKYHEISRMTMVLNPHSSKLRGLTFHFDKGSKLKGTSSTDVIKELPFKEGPVKRLTEIEAFQVNCRQGHYVVNVTGGRLFSVSRVVTRDTP